MSETRKRSRLVVRKSVPVLGTEKFSTPTRQASQGDLNQLAVSSQLNFDTLHETMAYR